jgi:hypothetical protein
VWRPCFFYPAASLGHNGSGLTLLPLHKGPQGMIGWAHIGPVSQYEDLVGVSTVGSAMIEIQDFWSRQLKLGGTPLAGVVALLLLLLLLLLMYQFDIVLGKLYNASGTSLVESQGNNHAGHALEFLGCHLENGLGCWPLHQKGMEHSIHLCPTGSIQ